MTSRLDIFFEELGMVAENLLGEGGRYEKDRGKEQVRLDA
jgi:hypothetical protein